MDDMEDMQRPRPTTQRKTLTPKERRRLLKKRIKDLRRLKRRQQRRSRRSFSRVLPVTLLAAFLLLCVCTGIYTFASSGEEQRYLVMDLPATNQAEIMDLALAAGQVSEPGIGAAAAILLDPVTGDVLYQKSADQPLPMASTTKIMTAIVVLENASLRDSVTISEQASSVGEASAWLDKGEILSVEQLLYALLVQSANDAAVALAEHVGGTTEAFVEMMNAKARDLGLANTHFSNPHGLDEKGHYTSARDLAALAAYAMRDPIFREMVAADGYQIPWPGHPFPRVLENHNKLLKMYPYATGIKTGYTAGAGKCLVAEAERGARELISVILNGGESYWDQTISLLEYGFNSFARVEYAYAGQPLASVEVGEFPRRRVNAVGRADLVFTVRRDRLGDLSSARVYSLNWAPYPVTAGQEIGCMVVGEGSPNERSEPLVSDGHRSTPNFLFRLFCFIGAVFALWWRGIMWLIPGL